MLARCAALVVAVALLAACSGPMVVGVILPETGESAAYGIPENRGAKVVLDKALASGTMPRGFDVIYRDSGSDPERAAAAMAELAKAGAVAVIAGATEAEAQPLAALADEEKVVMVSPSLVDPEIVSGSVYVFSVCPSADLEAVGAADILVRVRKARRILVLTDESLFARALLSRFLGPLRSRGGDVVDTISVSEEGWQRLLRDQIVARQPDGLYLCARGDALVSGLAAVRRARFEGVVCSTSALADRTVLDRAGTTAQSVMMPLPGLDLTGEKGPVAEFVAAYQKATGEQPDHFAALGHDAALAVVLAIRKMERRSATELQLRLKGLAEEPGVTGLLAFDDRGNIRHYPRTHWVRDGKVEDYEAYRDRLRRQLEERARQLGFGSLPD